MNMPLEKLDMLTTLLIGFSEVNYGSLRWLPHIPAKVRLSGEKGVIFFIII